MTLEDRVWWAIDQAIWGEVQYRFGRHCPLADTMPEFMVHPASNVLLRLSGAQDARDAALVYVAQGVGQHSSSLITRSREVIHVRGETMETLVSST